MRITARRSVAVAGEMLITCGVVLLLFVAYQLTWSNARAQAAASEAVESLTGSWAASPADPEVAPAPGEPFALLRIPRLGDDYVQPVWEGSGTGTDGSGISRTDLAHGVVHYPGTALPGQPGNLALAGHRLTQGEPFRHLDALQPGDVVTVETAARTRAYVVTSSEVVSPEQTDVLAPVPRRPGAPADSERLTLTTCHPLRSSAYRLVVYAHLQAGSGTGTEP